MTELRIRQQLVPRFRVRQAVLVARSEIVQPTMQMPPYVFRAIKGPPGDQAEFNTNLALLYAIAKL